MKILSKKNYRNIALTLSLSFITVSCSQPVKMTQAQKDITAICAAADDFDFKKHDDSALMAEQFYKMKSNLVTSKEVKNIIESIASTDNQWDLFLKGTKELGVKNLKCDTLKKYYQGFYNKN